VAFSPLGGLLKTSLRSDAVRLLPYIQVVQR
jgi:hypothetical protein